jgi:hypothetical protein
MDLIRTIDAKKHFAARQTQLGATCFSEIETPGTESNDQAFVEDFSVEYSSGGSVPKSK